MTSVGIGIGCGLPGSVAQWHPLYMSPTMLLDGLDESSFTLSGTDVLQWNDLSGNAFHAAPTGAGTRPTRNASTGVVSFDRGAGDWLNLAAALPDCRAGYYISLVGELADVGAIQQVMVTDYGAGANGVAIRITAGGELILDHLGVTAYSAAGMLTAGVIQRDFTYDATSVRYRESGGAWGTATKAAPNAYDGTNPASIGAYFNGVQPCSMSLVHALVICGRCPSAAELANHRAWVLRRYGV